VRVLDLLANPAHMDINRAYIANEWIIPELLEQLLTAKDLIGVGHEEFQKLERARLEREAVLAARGRIGGWVEHEIARGQHRAWCRICRCGSTKQRPAERGGDAREELTHPKWLGNIVVGA
jgi:hypothetical protein